MSRSYRKPWVTDGYRGSKRKQFMKRYANKVVRHSVDVPNGKKHRRFLDPWEICDFRHQAHMNDTFYKKEFWKYIRK